MNRKGVSASLFFGILCSLLGLWSARAAKPPVLERATQTPILLAYGNGSPDSLLIGGAAKGNWVSWKTAYQAIKGGEKYHFYTLGKYVGDRTGGKPTLSEASGAAYNIKLNRKFEKERYLIGLSSEWNAQPRLPKMESGDSPTYRAAVADVLKQKGLTGTKVYITRLARVDLEGDGTDEVLIEASSPNVREPTSDTPKPGSYTCVLLRKVVKGKPKTFVLDGAFIASKKRTEGDFGNYYRLGNVLDLDGDGKMEVIVVWNYYEGGGADVYTVRDGRTAHLLAASDGA